MSLDSILNQRLIELRASHSYRERQIIESAQDVEVEQGGSKVLTFCSNDYLGLANHPKVKEAFIDAVKTYGTGSGASHLVCGHSKAHHLLEEDLAVFTGRERALLYSTGYLANMGVINALTDRNDAVFEDKLNHASLIDGACLSKAKLVRYHHNDIDHLHQRLASSDARMKLVVTDGVFSMDGDLAQLPDLCDAASKFNAHVMVDDAHGLGCLGYQGKGTLNTFDLSPERVPILVGTLGKAFGTFGAFVAGSNALIESLIQSSRTYIYTTAIPPAVAAATRASLNILIEEDERREALAARITQFRKGCDDLNLNLMNSITAIQPLLIGSNQKALNISEQLATKGIWATAIRPPTVPAGTARIRFTFSANHTSEHVDYLLECLSQCGLNRFD